MEYALFIYAIPYLSQIPAIPGLTIHVPVNRRALVEVRQEIILKLKWVY